MSPFLRGIASRLFLLSALASVALAQTPTAEDAAALGGCLACGGSMMLIPIVILALNIALLVWVAKDAKSRGMDNTVLWIVLVLLLSVIGLVIYLMSRPQGELVQCKSCENKRLENSPKCPHCGNV